MSKTLKVFVKFVRLLHDLTQVMANLEFSHHQFLHFYILIKTDLEKIYDVFIKFLTNYLKL